MKTARFAIIVFFCLLQMSYSQESEVTSLALPVRNSLTFNRFIINPTFSFVREQHKYISVFNKREWVQFEDAPQTYLASYNGRFGENIGAGIGLFQQNFGVFTTFGAVANFAYNAQLGQDSNLTFGMNVGAYKSGLNTGNVVTNRASEDPSLNGLPSSTSLLINPGINYGTTFLDFGVSVNNLVVYNFEASELITDNPEQGIQGHLMYTGYMTSAGFFDEAKFSGLVKSEFKKEETIVSGIAMLAVPKGIWLQVGYNNLYGASGGLGINITPEVSMEYSYEKAVGALADFGSSHEITLAYRFKNKKDYYYSGNEDVAGLFSDGKKRRLSKAAKVKSSTTLTEKDPVLAKEKKLAAIAKAKKERQIKTKAVQTKFAEKNKEREDAKLEAKTKAEEELFEKAEVDIIAREEAKALAAVNKEQARETAEAQARAEVKAILEAKKQAKEAEAKAKMDTEKQALVIAQIKAEEELLAKAEADLRAREEAKSQATIKAKLEADRLTKAAAEAKARKEAEIKIAEDKARAEAKAKLEADRLTKAAAEAKARKEAEIKIAEDKARAEAKAKLEAAKLAKEAAEAKARKEAEIKIAEDKAKAEAKAKLEAAKLAKAAAEAKARKEAEIKIAEDKARAEAKAKLEADRLTKAAAEAKARKEAEIKIAEDKARAEAKAKLEAAKLAKEAAEAKARKEAEIKIAEDKARAEAKAKLEAAKLAKEAAEAKARKEAEIKIAEDKARAEAKTQRELEIQAKADAALFEKAEADLKAREEEKAKATVMEDLINEPKDEIGKSIKALSNTTKDSKNAQADLLKQLNDAVAIKDNDLKNLKEENDLSEQGIFKAPQPFKSITAENKALEDIKSRLDETIKSRNKKLKELESLYDKEYEAGTITNDVVMLYYKKNIDKLKTEQATAIRTRQALVSKLKTIKVALDYERKRRIKRASFNNEEDRYKQDRAVLKNIRENTSLSAVSFKHEDFDFGEAQSGSIQILKNVKNIENGYYVIVAVHTRKAKRDEFLRKAVASGRNDINFFYDVNTSRYYIYYLKSNSIKNANASMKADAGKPYNNNMSIIKIEN